MKLFRSNKMLGLAIGERSLVVAQLMVAERPRVQRLAEFVYPDGVTLTQAGALGIALGRFLRDKGFTAQHAVAGLPAKWLLVKSKEVPPADEVTTSRMLRLQVETEFSSELKDLVFDYTPAAPSAANTPRSVLLLATQRQYVTAIKTLCQSAKLSLHAIMPQASALAAQGSSQPQWILQLHPDNAELSAQTAGAATAIRHLRAAAAQPQFVGELRRAIASISAGGRPENLLVWNDAPFDADALGRQLGMPMRIGQLPDLGVDLHLNGTAPADGELPRGQFAAAIALALTGLDGQSSINFLRSRLAPPKVHRVPRWSIIASAAVLALIVGGVYAWRELQQQESSVRMLQHNLDNMSGEIKTADSFVSKVSFAQHWHGGEARYLSCLRDLTLVIPEDGHTYATSLILRDPSANLAAARPAGPNAKPVDPRILNGQLYGKTGDQRAVQTLIDRLKNFTGFSDVKLGGTQNAARNGEVAFSITFAYRAPVATASKVPPAPASPARPIEAKESGHSLVSTSRPTTQPARKP